MRARSDSSPRGAPSGVRYRRKLDHIAMDTSQGPRPGPAAGPRVVWCCIWCSDSLSNSIVNAASACESSTGQGSSATPVRTSAFPAIMLPVRRGPAKC